MNQLVCKLLNHRFVFEELVKRDFKTKYKRSILGIGWSVLAPLLHLLVMQLIFGTFFGKSVAHYTIYIFAGNICYSFYSEATSGGMSALLSNADIFSKINVPKYLFLLSKNVSAIISFCIMICIFFIFCLMDGLMPTWKYILLIYPVLCLIVLNIGIGMILSALFIFFRDIGYLYDIFKMLLMYTSAIFYSVDAFSPDVQWVFLVNPLHVIIKYFRLIVINNSIPSVEYHILMAVYALLALAIGSYIYKTRNHKFLYYV
ncbi:MAG: ABC transporter permease [Phascolarctobacterium sp.]|nr:ABC transporter permease [Phascolarctobacterium sp.]